RLLTELLSRVKFVVMARVLAVLAACLLLWGGAAHADPVATAVSALAKGKPAKVRTAAVLTLGKSKDPRAVIAVSGTVNTDRDPTIRRIAALALQNMLDARTPDD